MGTFITSRSLAKHEREITKGIEHLKVLHAQASEASQQSPGDSWHDNAPLELLRYEIETESKVLSTKRAELSRCVRRDYPRRLDNDMVQYGAGVLLNINGKEQDFKIVGFGDGDIKLGRIFYQAPLAAALLGHTAGDRFEISINGRTSRIEVKRVYPLGDLDAEGGD